MTAIWSRTSARHSSHSVKVRPSTGLKMGRGKGGQVALVQVISFQPNCCAAWSTAGNHMAAWESPKSTTLVFELVSPKVQGCSDVSV